MVGGLRRLVRGHGCSAPARRADPANGDHTEPDHGRGPLGEFVPDSFLTPGLDRRARRGRARVGAPRPRGCDDPGTRSVWRAYIADGAVAIADLVKDEELQRRARVDLRPRNIGPVQSRRCRTRVRDVHRAAPPKRWSKQRCRGMLRSMTETPATT